MTPTPLWTPIVLLGFAIMTASCAVSPPRSAVPPRLPLPTKAATPCELERLPEAATQADLEIAYVERGSQLVACEQARSLAVETLLAERMLQDRWRAGLATGRRRMTWRW